MVHRTGIYFIFQCHDPLDREAILQQHTTVIDGRIITFRGLEWYDVLHNINFNFARVWIRVFGLPVGYLSPEWPMQALSHVGYVEYVEHDGGEFPSKPEFHASVLVDLTRPLIPGCFLPLFNDQVIWVYFRYEGVFSFCKECGCVGHYTCHCFYPH